MDTQTAYGYLDVMQKVCMAEGSMVTLEEWLEENEPERKRYYAWMRNQVGYWSAGPVWH